MSGVIISTNLAAAKGDKKIPVDAVELIAGHGVQDDAHAGSERQVSLLAIEHITEASQQLGVQLTPGSFGENLTVCGLSSDLLHIGQRFTVGKTALVQISEIGKVCHEGCDIGRRLGECIMPRAGFFVRVMRGGRVVSGDAISPTDFTVGAVLTASDRCANAEREDTSGPLLINLLEELGVIVTDYSIMLDDEEPLSEKLRYLADRCAVDLILTTGGTGLGARDRMPEATLAVLQQQAPGFAEAIRAEGMRHTPLASISLGNSVIHCRRSDGGDHFVLEAPHRRNIINHREG
ncbi:MAG TPA: molybdopterin-binding protein [Armatimonadota bacterium]|nr:molybdopterin-binding protein [Armatimonadota bacterium]